MSLHGVVEMHPIHLAKERPAVALLVVADAGELEEVENSEGGLEDQRDLDGALEEEEPGLLVEE